jgi:hypothetical protein
MSEILAANRKTLLEQMQPNTGALSRSVLTDNAIRSWQKQPRSAARKERTAREFLTANSLEVSSVQQFTSALAKMSPRHSEHELVWRGQGNADWSVRSTLSRAVALRNGTGVATEDELVEAELDILASARKWGLNTAELASAPLHTLAELQHVGAPTRLLDVTRDPEIAAWFAVSTRGSVTVSSSCSPPANSSRSQAAVFPGSTGKTKTAGTQAGEPGSEPTSGSQPHPTRGCSSNAVAS